MMTRMLRIGCFILLLPTLAAARTLYVDNRLPSSCTSANYSVAARGCSGSDGLAYNSIQAAENASMPGDVVLIRGGEYRETLLFANGSIKASEPITYRNHSNEQVILKYPSSYNPWPDSRMLPILELARTANFLVFDGLEFDGEMGTMCTDEPYMPFTSGSVPIVPGESIRGSLSGKTAVVRRVAVLSGSWAAGNAKGNLWLDPTQPYEKGWTTEDILVSSSKKAATSKDYDGNLDIRGCRSSRALGYYFAIGNTNVGNSAQNITVRNCTIHDFQHAGIKGNPNWTIEFTHLYNLGFAEHVTNKYDHGVYLTGANVIFRYNFVHDTACISAVITYGSGAAEIYGNIMSNYGKSGMGECGALWLLNPGNHKIYNNIFDGSNAAKTGIIIGKDSVYDLSNNIFMRNKVWDISLDNAMLFVPGSISRGNVFAATQICSYDCNYPNTRVLDDLPPNLKGAPSFAAGDPINWLDYRLAQGSLAIDVGVDLGPNYRMVMDPRSTSWPPRLLDQMSLGHGWEVGPFGHLPVPSPPQSVRQTP